MVRWKSYTTKGRSEFGKWDQGLYAHSQNRRVQELLLEMLPRLLLLHLGQSDHGRKIEQASTDIHLQE